MNIFPLDIQYLIAEFISNKNEKIIKKEIILLYTYPEYSHTDFKGFYSPEKIEQEKIELDVYLLNISAYFGNIRVMIFLFEKGCPWNFWTFEKAAEHGNLENMKWLRENGCPGS